MSYSIVYDKKFVKTKKGVITIVLSGSSNLSQTNHKGQQVRCRDWNVFRYTVLPAPAAEIMLSVRNELPSTYNEHFKYNGKWVDDKGLVSFFESGIRNALTLEEMLEKYVVNDLSVEVLADDIDSGEEYPSKIIYFHQYCRSNDDLEEALETATAIYHAQPEKAHPCTKYSFGEKERLKTRKKTRRTVGVKTEMGYLILLGNGNFFQRRSSRHMWHTIDMRYARVFRSQDEAVKYVRTNLGGYEIAKNVDVLLKKLVICTRDRKQYWAGRGFVMSDTFAKAYNTQAQAEKALATAVLVNSDAITDTAVYPVLKMDRDIPS